MQEFRLRKRPFLVRFWKCFKANRSFGISVVTSLKFSWKLNRPKYGTYR